MDELTEKQTQCFSFVLQRLLEKHDMKQIDVAQAIGMPQSTFHDWITGRSPRDLCVVKKIADYFGVEFEFMIFGTKTDQEKMQAYIRKLEFDNAIMRLEGQNQLNLFESKEDAIKRINMLKLEIEKQFPDLEEAWQ
ncbi:MAG: helix-turn-helix transcriptional regulator [Croceitalea sp.]|nr:helix-turn-helix transcriptional regulator [Croceitalea sp.]